MSNFKTLKDLKKDDDDEKKEQISDNYSSNDPKVKSLSTVYFEKQIANLCGVHVVNNALQQRFFDEIRLAEIADHFDDTELERMAEGGRDTKEFKEFIENRSSTNYDESGNFSIQVLTQAFQAFGVELVPWNSDTLRARLARKNPLEQKLILCHSSDHWYCYRRFGDIQWVLLNSLEKGPKLISDTYMQMLLASMEEDNRVTLYFGFGVTHCPADTEFSNQQKPAFEGTNGQKLGFSAPSVSTSQDTEKNTVKADEVRKQRAAFLARFQQNSQSQTPTDPSST